VQSPPDTLVTSVVKQIETRVTESNKKSVRTAKKTITTEIATAVTSTVVNELLPFTFNGNTYLRMGSRRENGNHLWTSGHLWTSKKGAKGHHYGQILDDGTIDMNAEEPSF
jgi:hypothetical protein